MLYYSITNEENKMELLIGTVLFVIAFTWLWYWIDERI